MDRRLRLSVGIVAFAGALLLTACTKKQAPIATPRTPTLPAAPTATLAASPSVIQQGQATELTWQTTNASDITIAGLGAVAASGSHAVTPGTTTTYTLTAKGEGGTQDATATVTVNPVAAAVVTPPAMDLTIRDVFFDYDKYVIRSDAEPITQEDASYLAQHPEIKVLIEGHCDDRGSIEYNMVLGENRANAVKEALLRQGVEASRIKVISFGKEKPFCSQENEQCWQENRRGHIVSQR